MTTFFTSDAHFGHKKIIEYCSRPWPTVEEMQEALISRWNEKVKPEDTVYFLGDFAMGPKPAACSAIAERLNGTKHLILGNHDYSKVLDAIRPHFASVNNLIEVTVEEQLITLCHFPMYRWNKAQFGSWMLHGHSHGQLKYSYDAKICDVSMDAWNWYPVTLAEIRPKMEAKPIVFETDRTEVR